MSRPDGTPMGALLRHHSAERAVSAWSATVLPLRSCARALLLSRRCCFGMRHSTTAQLQGRHATISDSLPRRGGSRAFVRLRSRRRPSPSHPYPERGVGCGVRSRRQSSRCRRSESLHMSAQPAILRRTLHDELVTLLRNQSRAGRGAGWAVPKRRRRLQPRSRDRPRFSRSIGAIS
jgi:hypothetical protein